MKRVIISLFAIIILLNSINVLAEVNDTIRIRAGEGSCSGYIKPGEFKEFIIDKDIMPDCLVILSLSNLQNNEGAFNYLTLQNIETGLVVCRENNNGSNEGGHWERSRIRYFTVEDSINTKYKAVVSAPDDNGYTGGFTIDVKIAKKMTFSGTDTKGKPVTPESKTYCISSNPEALHPLPRDVLFYGAENNRPSELGENGYYLQRSPVNGNANIFWEHMNEYGRDMKFGVLLWNTDEMPLTIKLNSRSFYGNESDRDRFICATRIWIENMRGLKSIARDETDDYYKGFDEDMKITIPAYNPDDPSSSAKWITLHTANGYGSFCYFTGIMDISIYDDDGNEYAGQNLFCDTYCMNMGTTGGIPSHEVTRRKVASMQRAIGDSTYRGSAESAILEADIKGTTIIDEDNPFSFVITGFDVPALNPGELMPITDVIWDKQNNKPTGQVKFIEEYNSGSPVQNIRECNGRIRSCNFGVIYKIKFDNLKSDKPVLGKIKFNPKVINIFDYFTTDWGYPDIQVAVYDEDGKAYETGLTREYKLDRPLIEGVFNTDIKSGDTFYIVVGGMSNMPLEVSFENANGDYSDSIDADYKRDGLFTENSEIKSNIMTLTINNPDMTLNKEVYEIDPGNNTTPVIVNSRTLLPIRAIIEKMGGTVAWDETEKKVTVNLGKNIIKLWIDSQRTEVNGEERIIDTAPQIINNRTMLPIRFIAENLGCDVEWDNEYKEVSIIY